MEEKINIKSIILKILSRWHYFLIAIMITMPLAYLYIKQSSPKYEIKSSILIKNEETKGPENFLKGMELMSSQIELEDEIGILKSFANVSQTLNTLNFGISYFTKSNFKTLELYEKKPFTIVLDSSINQVVGIPIYLERLSSSKCLVSASEKNVGIYNVVSNEVVGKIPEFHIEEVFDIGKPFVNKYLSFEIIFDETVKTDEKVFFRIENLEHLAKNYAGRLSVKPASLKSNIVEVSISEQVPQKGIDFLSRLTAVYLDNELFKKNQLGLKTIQFIDDQISGVSDTLKSVEGSLESYRAQNNVLDIRSKAENLTRNLDNLEQQKADVQVKIRYCRQISNTLDSDKLNDIVAPSTFGITDPLLNNLLVELSKLNQEKSGLNYSTREGNPLAEVIELKISNNKKLIKENISNIIDASSIALEDFNRRIAQYSAQLDRLPRNERELVKIQRRFDFSDNVYNYLLEKRAEAGIAIASNVPSKAIIDEAMQVGTGPTWPNNKLIYAIALVVALGGALGIIVLKDAMNDNIITHDDLLRNTKLPFLGAIIHGSRRERDGVVANAMSPVGESFRTLRVNLQYLTFGAEVKVIGFTSSRESEGKTFCAVNLAASMAHSRKRTVLIDADMRRPRVASYFQLEADKGLSSYLIGDSSVKEVISETGIKGFDVITSGPIPPNPLDLIGQPRMGELISELKKMYDTIIIDAPPIGYVSEYVILMRYTDSNIYVVRSEYTTRFNLDRVNKLYEEKKISNFSVLLNDVKYSQANGYSYSYKYKKKKNKIAKLNI